MAPLMVRSGNAEIVAVTVFFTGIG